MQQFDTHLEERLRVKDQELYVADVVADWNRLSLDEADPKFFD